MGSLIRDAVEQTYPEDQDRKRKALDKILSLELPVDEWEVMEKEIEERWLGCEVEKDHGQQK